MYELARFGSETDIGNFIQKMTSRLYAFIVLAEIDLKHLLEPITFHHQRRIYILSKRTANARSGCDA